MRNKNISPFLTIIASSFSYSNSECKVYTVMLQIYKPSRNERLGIKHLSQNLKNQNLRTICQEALCPNRFECFSHGVATFLVLGEICTRNCKFCYVKKGKPKKIDVSEPCRIAHAVKEMTLQYVVVTCVTRDDLEDGGAEVFAKTVKAIRKNSPECKIELLISDLNGNFQALEKIIDSKPDVLGHNIDVAKNLHKKIKPKSDYALSIRLLKKIKEIDAGMKTKSGIMLGLGENEVDIIDTMKEIREAGVDFFTLGQYLSPSEKHARVEKFYSREEFKELERIAYQIDFEDVASSPLTRSSYRADKLIKKLKK